MQPTYPYELIVSSLSRQPNANLIVTAPQLPNYRGRQATTTSEPHQNSTTRFEFEPLTLRRPPFYSHAKHGTSDTSSHNPKQMLRPNKNQNNNNSSTAFNSQERYYRRFFFSFF